MTKELSNKIIKHLSPKRIIPLTLIGTMTLFTSCDDDNPISQAVDEIEEVSELQQMQEKWQAPCSDSSILSASTTENVTFSGKDFTQEYLISSDTSCSTIEGVVTYNGNFEIDESNNGQDSYDLDLSYQEMKVLLNSETAVDLFNAVNFCGIEDWQINQERVVVSTETGANCFIDKLPKTLYGKVLVDDSEDKMYLSAEFTENPEERSETVDRAKVYSEID